jgi:thioredoxin-dependent peroxiredoxin
VVLGVSPDSTESHRKFIKKHSLAFSLLSDPSRKMMNAYQGAKGKRTVRSTVIIDPKGNVAHRFAKVNVRSHAEDVLNKIKELKKK